MEKNKMNIAALVDWGTSSFRLWLLNDEGEIVLGARTSQGMSTLNSPAEFGSILEKHLSALDVRDDLPVMICGMAGARQGWVEAAYVNTPASLKDVVSASVKIPNIKRDVRILPGVAQISTLAPDVMRGEETQLMGASILGNVSSIFCMPGTHSKWVTFEDNTIKDFSSFMTGEIFALLSKHSTLSHSINEEEMDMEAFDRSAMLGFEKPELTSQELFSVRAAPLLGLSDMAKAKGKLSGLLIGLELAGARRYLSGEITLIGSGKLAELYKRAFNLVEVGVKQVDGEEAVCAGLKYAASNTWTN